MSAETIAARRAKHAESVRIRQETCRRVAARYLERAGEVVMDGAEREAVQRRRAGLNEFRKLLEERRWPR